MSSTSSSTCFMYRTRKPTHNGIPGRRVDLQLFAGEKTEDPTPRRRLEARRKGEVARSAELSGTLVLMAGVVALRYTVPGVAATMQRETQELISRWTLVDLSVQNLSDLSWELAGSLYTALAPLLVVLVVVALFSNLVQTGFSIAPRPMESRMQSLNPVEGLKRLVSRRSLFELAKGFLKLGGVGLVTYLVLRSGGRVALQLADLPFEQAITSAAGLTWDLLLKTTGVLLVLAAGDYAYQRWDFERNLKMSREEVKQDMKETEGDPQLKGRVRRQQRDMVRRRMLGAVKDAAVVVVNPTHYAVALGYEHDEHPAPVVLAKGQGYLALRIRALAEDHGVPIMEEPAVARALYRSVEVGQYIPPELYRAVAEILALVWRMKGKRSRQAAT